MKLKALLLFAILSVLPTYAGTVTGTMQGPSGLVVKNGTLTFNLQQAGLIVGTGNVAQLTAQCFTSSDGTVVGVPNPLALPIVGVNTSAGNLPAGIYYVELTYFNGAGESIVSPELQIQLTSTGALIVSLPSSGLPASATGIHVYIGTSRGSETLQGSFNAAFPGTYSQNVPLVAGATPPGSNTAPCTIAFNDTIIPYQGYKVSLTSSSGNAFPGWPQAWQLNGGLSGTVNVSSGAPLFNGTVIYPMPILSQPLNHGPQSISGPLNMTGYDLTNVGNFTAVTSLEGAYIPPTIPQAIASAGATGSVLIPPYYTGTENWTNPSNVRVQDNRPFNPQNQGTYTAQIMPQTTIKASEFGALCNGIMDDYPSIQKAVNALTNVVGITQINPQPMNQGTVELPQGRCTISQPIVLTNYGSIQGSSNGTWLTPASTWSAGDAAMIQLTQSYAQSSFLNQGVTTINRFVRNINFFYNANVHNISGIQVINPTGHTSAQPYPASAQFALYQLPGVIIEGNTFFAMDTAIDMEDCGECVIENNQIFFVRMGVEDMGNNYSMRLVHNAIQAGSYNFTRTPTGATVGIYSVLQTRWQVVSGTPTQSLVVSPQGLDVGDSIITTFDRNASLINCQGCDFHDDGFDFGGDGAIPGTINPSVYVATLNQVQFHHDYFASNQTNGISLEISDANSVPVDSFNLDGVWITDCYFQNYTNTGTGIQYDAGTNGRRNNWIDNNQFSHMAGWITINQPLSYSNIRGNYGFLTSGPGITFNATGSSSFTNTIVADNTTSDAIHVIVDTAGSGYLTGWNQGGSNSEVVQLTGSFTATGTGCSITGGAIGDTCTVTMNNQIPFGDTAYVVTGCSITAPSTPAHMGFVTTPTLGTQFSVAEVADSTSAVTGGTVACTVNHQ